MRNPVKSNKTGKSRFHPGNYFQNDQKVDCNSNDMENLSKIVKKIVTNSVGEGLPAEKGMKSFIFCVFPVGYFKSSQTASFSRLEIASFGK